jgi:alanyl-tRNA synthetase
MMGDVFADQNFALNVPKTEFLGYSETKANAKVLKVFAEGEVVKIILDRTPFYAESGGQVGDTGLITGPSGKIRVEGTQKTNDIFIHAGKIESGAIKEGDQVEAVIDEKRRQSIMRNHTATHLLQTALREVLGPHIKQQGSSVDENRLRFDFAHHQGVKPEELKRIEDRLNSFVQSADPVKKEVLPIEEAKKKGALAFFAEKYGDVVRVISIGNYSTEFCGGTHLDNTSEIEAIKLVSEGSVAQGIRRIEAVTGKDKVDIILKQKQEQETALEELQRQKQLEKEQQAKQFENIKSSMSEIIAQAENINGVKVLKYYIKDTDMGTLRKVSDLVKQRVPSIAMVLGTHGTTTVSMVIAATDDIVAQGFNAPEVTNYVAPIIDGAGGGRPNMAQVGGKAVNKFDEALNKAKEKITLLVRGNTSKQL